MAADTAAEAVKAALCRAEPERAPTSSPGATACGQLRGQKVVTAGRVRSSLPSG